ncbi:MAG: FAD-dependent oxidoreductase [Pseudomonadota bacterium]
MDGKGNSLIVVGAGVWGLSCALVCAQRGWAVTVLEARQVGSGASGGIVGAMAPHTPDNWNPKKQFQFEALDQADAFWADVEKRAGKSTGYGRIGRVQPISDVAGLRLATDRGAGAQSLWAGRHTWQVIDRPNWLSPDQAPFGVIHDTLSARIHPAKATAALGHAVVGGGVEILEGVNVTDLSQTGVVVNGKSRDADAVIVAAGVGGFDLLAPFTARAPGTGQKGQAALLGCDLRGRPQLYADGLYIVPHADGTTAVGSTSENTYVDPIATDVLLEDVIIRARALMPELTDAPIVQRWVGLRPKPRKRDPMLGPIPGLDRHFAALGAFKIGFGLAGKVATTLADCIENRGSVPESFLVSSQMK